jgi:hypothetical protein
MFQWSRQAFCKLKRVILASLKMIRVDNRFVEFIEALAELLCGKEAKVKDTSEYDAAISV